MSENYTYNFKMPNDWTLINFAECCEKISLNGIKIKQKEYQPAGKFPVVDQGQELIGGYFNNDELVVPGEPPFIIFGDHTKVKKYINFKFIAGADGVKVLKPYVLFNPKLFYYFIHCVRLPDKGYARHFQFLEKVEYPIPPLPEQHAIVSRIEQLFSELDKGIESLKTAQQQLKVYRQSVLKWAFEGKLTEKWRQNQALPDAQELLEQIQNEREEKAKVSGKKLKQVAPLTKEELAALPELQKGWAWVRLGELSIGVEYGSAAKSKEAGKVPVLRMGNIQNGRFDWQSLVYTDNDAEIKKYLLKRNDVLFNRTNSPELVGKTSIYKGERPAIFAGYLIRINYLPTIVDADYLNYFLNSHFAKTYGNSVKTDGVNQSNINGERLKGYPFPICSLSEQHQIVQEIESRLSECDNMETTITASLQQAEALRQSILKKAFEGRLLNEKEMETVRQDPVWEPAERLLERIRAEKAVLHSEEKGRKSKA